MATGDIFGDSPCELPILSGLPDYSSIDDPTVYEPPYPLNECLDTLPAAPPEPPCPVLTPADQEFLSPMSASDQPLRARLMITRGTCCDFDFAIELGVPCVAIGPYEVVSYPTIVSGPSRTILTIGRQTRTLSDYYPDLESDDCSIVIDLDQIEHCPQMTMGAIVGSVGDATITPTFSLSAVADENCDFTWTGTFTVPGLDFDAVCTTVNSTYGEVTKLQYTEEPSFELTFYKAPDSCDIDVSAKLDLPCGNIVIGEVNAYELPYDQTPTFDLQAEPDEDPEHPDACQMKISGSFGFPSCKTKLTPGYSTVTMIDYDQDPSAEVIITGGPGSGIDDCEMEVALALYIPTGGGGSSDIVEDTCGVRGESVFDCVNGKLNVRAGCFVIHNGKIAYKLDAGGYVT